MSTGQTEQATGARQAQPTEEELRAAYEAEIKKIRVEQMLLEHVVTLINLGMRRTGLAPGHRGRARPRPGAARDRGDPGAAAAGRAGAPRRRPAPIRDAASQLQLAYVQARRAPPADPARRPGRPRRRPEPAPAEPPGRGRRRRRPTAAGQPEPEPPKPGEPGPAQRSGRLWVPGQ